MENDFLSETVISAATFKRNKIIIIEQINLFENFIYFGSMLQDDSSSFMEKKFPNVLKLKENYDFGFFWTPNKQMDKSYGAKLLKLYIVCMMKDTYLKRIKFNFQSDFDINRNYYGGTILLYDVKEPIDYRSLKITKRLIF